MFSPDCTVSLVAADAREEDLIKKTVALFEKLCSRWKPLIIIYCRPYVKVVQNEIDLACITAADRVLNIGCGAVPFTAILIARLTGAQIVAIDRDPKAAQLAEACVRKMGLTQCIQIAHRDGSQEVERGFDVAVVALQAEPKARILSSLSRSSHRPTRVVARVPSRMFRSQYDTLPRSCKVVAQVPQSMKTFDRSVLISA